MTSFNEAVHPARRPDRTALLLVSATRQLRPRDRVALLARAPATADLLRLSHLEVELTIGRRLDGARWTPAALLPQIERAAAWLTRAGHHVWWIGDADYPAPLRRAYDPPAVLFGRGDAAALAAPMVAVVGTRRPSEEGRVAAFRMGAGLAAEGVSVVSGLALGIDGAAHAGVASVGGRGVAVLGSGIDAVTPRSNRSIAADLLSAGGIILSEYLPGEPATRYHFPARNRIIAHLSRAVVVTQAPAGSGALITVEFALDSGIDVLVDRVGAAMEGTTALLSDGAPIVTDAVDVLDHLSLRFRPGEPRSEDRNADLVARHDQRLLSLFDGDEARVTRAAARRRASSASTSREVSP